MPRYTVIEPHPTVAKDSYTHSGRGGAGNTFRAPLTTPPTGVPTAALPAPASSSARFYSGRGGAGNAHAASARSGLSLSEEYVMRENAHPSFHVGRGGAGNVFRPKAESTGKGKASMEEPSRRRDSHSTTGSSVRSGFFGRLSGVSLGHRS